MVPSSVQETVQGRVAEQLVDASGLVTYVSDNDHQPRKLVLRKKDIRTTRAPDTKEAAEAARRRMPERMLRDDLLSLGWGCGEKRTRIYGTRECGGDDKQVKQNEAGRTRRERNEGGVGLSRKNGIGCLVCI